jgi:hypothetical protein
VLLLYVVSSELTDPVVLLLYVVTSELTDPVVLLLYVVTSELTVLFRPYSFCSVSVSVLSMLFVLIYA